MSGSAGTRPCHRRGRRMGFDSTATPTSSASSCSAQPLAADAGSDRSRGSPCMRSKHWWPKMKPHGKSAAVPRERLRNRATSSAPRSRSRDCSMRPRSMTRCGERPWSWGCRCFSKTVAAPLLRKVGDEWHAGRLSPAHEHLVTSSLHAIIVAMMRAFSHRPGAPTVLVTTSAGERHVIGAALVGAAAALEGWNVLYLGANLPAGEIADAAAATSVRVVAVSIIYVEEASRVRDEMRALRDRLPAGCAAARRRRGRRIHGKGARRDEHSRTVEHIGISQRAAPRYHRVVTQLVRRSPRGRQLILLYLPVGQLVGPHPESATTGHHAVNALEHSPALVLRSLHEHRGCTERR